MNTRLAIGFAVVAGLAIGAAGYALGMRNGAAPATESAMLDDIVKETMSATPPAPAAESPAMANESVAAMAPANAAAPMTTTSTPTMMPTGAPTMTPAAVPTGAPMMAAQPSAMSVPEDSQTALNDEERSQVEGIIRNYLIANPEIIRDAINALQLKEDAAAQQQQVSMIGDNKKLIFSSSRQVVLGNPKGDVTLVEFFDYNCGYCRRAHADMKQLIAEDPNLRVVLKEFPILGDGSVQAAQIAVAVLLTSPDKYPAFHDELISEKGAVDGDKALAVAQDIGLDPAVLRAKADSDEVKANINEVRDLAQKLDLTGTPSYVTASAVVVGAVGYDNLKAEIAKAREACKQAANC
jgi:protein-disulfide isomerase